MILKINQLELRNNLIEKQILEKRENLKEIKDIIKEKKNENEKINEEDEEIKPLKEEIKDDKIIEEIKEDNNNIIEEDIPKETKPKTPAFVPHEIKERIIEEEPWTVIKKGDKKKKPQ